MSSTIRLHRVFRSPPDRLYRAFTDPDALARWLPPFGFVGKVHEMDARVDGRWRMSFIHFASGHTHSFGGTYLELVPGERLRYTSVFDDPSLPGTMETLVTLKPVSVGTEFVAEQSNIPDVIPAEACYLGWQESLTALKQLVEPEIPT